MILQVGDIIQDNDKRMRGRVLRITSMDSTHVRACARFDTAIEPRTVRIRKDRIADHFRSFGFTRIAHGRRRNERVATD